MDRGKPPRHRDYPSCASRTRVGRSGSPSVSGLTSPGRRRKARLLVGSAAAVVILAGLAGLMGIFYPGREAGPTAEAKPASQYQCIPPAQPGIPRPWEASIEVSTYSVANAVNRNLLTVIPIIGWSGVGPDISMSLFHNSSLVDSEYDLAHGSGYDLGPGWTLSYGAMLFKDFHTADVTIIHDDGTHDIYTYNGSGWDPPRGVHDILTWDFSRYRLTHKDQSYHEFDGLGHLTEVGDGLGNTLSFQRDMARLVVVTDAADRELWFGIDYPHNRPSAITDPVGPGDEPGDIDVRTWYLDYDGYGRLAKVTDPMGYDIDIGYDADGRIAWITDKHDPLDTDPPTYHYDYNTSFDQDAIYIVTDPEPDQLTQVFETTCDGWYEASITYTDRRWQEWEYYSWREDTALYPYNGPLEWIKNPLGQYTSFDWDADRNMTVYRDALNHEWTYTYDDHGNMLSATSPLDDTQSWTYGSYNNVTSYTDAADNVTDFHYDVVGYPTLLTQIVEPPAESGGDDPVTTLAYYIDDPIVCEPAYNCDHGLLKEVVDPNGVVTSFVYDRWGQLDKYREGTTDGGATWVYRMDLAADSGSRVHHVVTLGPGEKSERSSGTISYNPLNQPTTSICVGVPVPKAEGAASAPLAADFPVTPCAAPSLPYMYAEWDAEYTPMGNLDVLDVDFWTDSATTFERQFDPEYDELGRLTDRNLSFDDHDKGDPISRDFAYAHDLANGQFTRTGPDGVETFVQLDVANRVQYVERRVPGGQVLMRADYTYYANGLVHTVTYANGASIEYTYDDANRIWAIEHRNAIGLSMLKLRYIYCENRDLPEWIVEYHLDVPIAHVGFAYDDRGRLTEESRGDDPLYHFQYEYDLGGNRTKMTDVLAQKEVVYHYDIEDPATYESANNRLMYSETFEIGNPNAESTKWYYYNDVGNVTRVVTHEEGSEDYSATRLAYAANGQAVTFVFGETWQWDGESSCETPGTYDISYAREFRYDGARQRYLSRELDPVKLLDEDIVALSETWSDYDGDEIYGDYTIDAQGLVTETMSYEPGMARTTDPLGAAVTAHYHTDHLGSTRLMTDGTGSAIEAASYSAFGEPLSGPNHRYGYAGRYGYQAHADLPFLHVGARYYDPATGRFLQRDPIGIARGANVYSYVNGRSTSSVDPDGTYPFDVMSEMIIEGHMWTDPGPNATTEQKIEHLNKVAFKCGVLIGLLGFTGPSASVAAFVSGVIAGAAALL